MTNTTSPDIADGTPDTPVTAPQTPQEIRAAAARAFVLSLPIEQQTIDNTAVDFYEQSKVLPGILTRIGNSHVGVAPEARAHFQTDGAPIRTSCPTTLERVAIETHKSGAQLIRTLSGWAEGRWSTCWWSMAGQYCGGHFDFPWDHRHDNVETQRYGIGLLGYTEAGYVGDTPDSRAATLVTITEIPPSDTTTVPGYWWTSGASGCELRTPRFHAYCVDSFDAALPDPGNPSRMFTAGNVFYLDWSKAGDGQEYRFHRPTLDIARYPTDPRLDRTDQRHIDAVRKIGKDVFQYSSYQAGSSLAIHRWDEDARVMVPVLSFYASPHEDGEGATSQRDAVRSLVGFPRYGWNEGCLWRDSNGDGNLQAGEWTVFPTKGNISTDPGNWHANYALWNDVRMSVDPKGVVYFLPCRGTGTGGSDLRPVLRWDPFDAKTPTPAPKHLEYLSLPDTLLDASADASEHLRVEWKSGDLFAIVRRKSNNGHEWRLEKYSGWLKASEKARKTKKAAFSVANIATNVRREYSSMSPYRDELECSWDAVRGAMKGAVGGLCVAGSFIAIAEAQGCGIRVYRAKDGRELGRCFSPETPNATVDCPQAFQAWLTKTELIVTIMDFHGGGATWRIKLSDLV